LTRSVGGFRSRPLNQAQKNRASRAGARIVRPSPSRIDRAAPGGSADHRQGRPGEGPRAHFRLRHRARLPAVVERADPHVGNRKPVHAQGRNGAVGGAAGLSPGREDGRVSLLEAFIESISLTTDLDRWDQGSASLTLMTLHCAKGLEFDVVYMVGMEEEVFPHVNSFRPDVHDLEEERRLCYVGMTRAKSRLTFTYAESRRLYGFRQHNLPSRFLNEIPTSLYETITRFSPESDEEETVILD